jgi:hypothetical protein
MNINRNRKRKRKRKRNKKRKSRIPKKVLKNKNFLPKKKFTYLSFGLV